MALLEGSVIGKAAVALVGVAAGGFAAFNYASTGCPLGSCDKSADAAVATVSTASAGEGSSCCPLMGAESATTLVSAEAESECASSCSSTCDGEKAAMFAVNNASESECSSACSKDANFQLVANAKSADAGECESACETECASACEDKAECCDGGAEAVVLQVSNEIESSCDAASDCSSACASDCGESCDPDACGDDCPAKVASADAVVPAGTTDG